MPDELDELRRRLDTVESRLDSESGLRAMMDHDLAKLTVRLDAQDRLLRALSATQSDHTQRLTRIEDRVGGLEVRFTGLEERFGGLEEQFGAIVERFGRVEGTVSRVEVGVQAILGLLSNGR
jgi:septal ring factor EnvC (AmiA/AmiB activator)